MTPGFDPAVAVTALVALVGALFFIAYLARRGEVRETLPRRAVKIPCPVCDHPMIVAPKDLTPISTAEAGLVVSQAPEALGRKLAEFKCPHCDADHTFAVDGRRPEWIIANAFAPHTTLARCAECGTPLDAPPWPRGRYDKRIKDAPAVAARLGLVCGKCGAACCIECVKLASRGRTKDGSLRCPRCFRSPVERFYHP